MIFKLLPEKSEIIDFETVLEQELVITERDDPKLPRYYVQFNSSAIKGGPLQGFVYGEGNTIDEALKNYCKLISHKTIVINAMLPTRKAFTLPELVHTQLLGR